MPVQTVISGEGEAAQVALATAADLDRALCSDRRELEAPGWDEVTVALVDPDAADFRNSPLSITEIPQAT